MDNSTYWNKRIIKERENLTSKNIRDTEKQLSKYYRTAMNGAINEFEAVYDKLLTTEGEISPATLYSLDKYWKMQGQLAHHLEKLGDKQAELLSKQFMKEYAGVYMMALVGDAEFTTADTEVAKQIINSIWTTDGTSWSQRIWSNLNILQETLNEQLVHCVVTGKKTSELKRMLQERFKVSHSRADTLVRTEIARIETQASLQRYKDYGLEKYRVLVSPDSRTCDSCSQYDNKEYYLAEMRVGVNAPPFHPNCRDTIIPVV